MHALLRALTLADTESTFPYPVYARRYYSPLSSWAPFCVHMCLVVQSAWRKHRAWNKQKLNCWCVSGSVSHITLCKIFWDRWKKQRARQKGKIKDEVSHTKWKKNWFHLSPSGSWSHCSMVSIRLSNGIALEHTHILLGKQVIFKNHTSKGKTIGSHNRIMVIECDSMLPYWPTAS